MQTGAPTRRTIFGLERQGLSWTVVIGAVALALAVGLPLLDAAIPVDNAPAAGAVYDVGLGVQITPADDWSTTPRSHQGSGVAEFTRAGARVTVEAMRFSGTTLEAYEQFSAALDEQDGVQLTSDPQTFTARGGLVGIAGTFATPGGQGYLAVSTAHGVAATLLAEGATEVFASIDGEIVGMIASLQIAPAP
jgi:hypothetical protein